MKTLITAALSISALGLAVPAIAQDAPSPATPEAGTAAPAANASAPAAASAAAKAGDTVYDQAGEVVGTVESVAAPNFVISTGANKATVPLSALGSGPKGLVIGMTKAQLDAAIQGAQSAAPAPAAQ